MYFLSIRYILILSCSVVSYFKKRGRGGGRRKKEKKKRKEKATGEDSSSYLIKLAKHSIVPLVHFAILYTLNSVRDISLGYCIYLRMYLSVSLCIPQS